MFTGTYGVKVDKQRRIVIPKKSGDLGQKNSLSALPIKGVVIVTNETNRLLQFGYDVFANMTEVYSRIETHYLYENARRFTLSKVMCDELSVKNGELLYIIGIGCAFIISNTYDIGTQVAKVKYDRHFSSDKSFIFGE